jgi:hypothetical protein
LVCVLQERPQKSAKSSGTGSTSGVHRWRGYHSTRRLVLGCEELSTDKKTKGGMPPRYEDRGF